MLCKFCSNEIEDNVELCPHCGKNLNEESMMTEEAVTTEESVETLPETMTEDLPQEQIDEAPENEELNSQNPEPKKEKKEKKSNREVWTLVFSIVAAVLALCALAVALLMAFGFFDRFDKKTETSGAKKPAESAPLETSPSGIVPPIESGTTSTIGGYTVDAETAEKNSLNVVATMGDKELTNIQLQLYYRMQVMDFLNYYGSYASQLGFDYTKPLSDQPCAYDETKSWEEYMIDVAIDTWKNYQSLGLLAEEAGFELDGEWLETLEQIPTDLQKQAQEDGYDSIDALLKEVIGAGCTEEQYMQYVRLACLSNAYYMHMEESMQPTEEDVDVYFAENEETLAQSGITKDMGMISDVRHILIQPEGGTVDETTGMTVYSDEEKAAAKKEAEKILKEWKKGEATEESFAQLATTYTDDGGSKTTGGLYEDIAPGASYVENFLNWAIDMSREVGDTDIVETEFGYHIMYYVSGEPYWRQVVSTQMLSESVTKMTDGAKEKWPAEVNYDNIFLAELKLT